MDNQSHSAPVWDTIGGQGILRLTSARNLIANFAQNLPFDLFTSAKTESSRTMITNFTQDGPHGILVTARLSAMRTLMTDTIQYNNSYTLFAAALTVFLALPLLLAIRKLVTARCHLVDFPGPSWAAYTRLWLSQTLASGNSAQILVGVNKKHGAIARVGPNHLVTSDPELTRQILAVGSKWRRGPWFDAIRIDPRVSNIVSERDPRVHNAMRRRMAPGYAGKDIHGLEDAVDERVGGFIARIEKYWVSDATLTKSFDIAKRIQYFTIDTITQLCFGKPMGFVESDADKHNFIATIEMQLPIVQHFSVFLGLNAVLRWVSVVPLLRGLVVPSSSDKSGIGVIMGVCMKATRDTCTANYCVVISPSH